MTSRDITNSIQPDHGYFGENWPDDFAIPRSLSTGGWTVQAPGYEQQTFLGASITNFSMTGGFGDSSSTLSVDVVVDEFNKSDETGLGEGDDVYHSGTRDQFRPPFVGSPVFFKFGKYRSSIQDAFFNTIQEIVSGESSNCDVKNQFEDGGQQIALNEITTLPSGSLYDTEDLSIKKLKEEAKSCGLTFGGILQSYTQNRSSNGNPLYSIQVTDPREILGNVKLLLNHYTGSVHDNDNIFNIYGFLEYDPPEAFAKKANGWTRNEIKRTVNNDGTVKFDGNDTFLTFDAGAENPDNIAKEFPITGRGFSRRSEQGIPFYRVNQALQALFEYGGELPDEYKEVKFGNHINFRGFKYVVDLTGLPALPDFYYLDFDEMSLLELALEVCDVMNRDLYVSLLPVIDHPYCKFLFDKNGKIINASIPEGEDIEESDLIAGIIRLDALDRSKQQDIGAIKSYLDDLEKQKIYVENRDVGFEVSNITTDKFIAGAQETDMYFFSTAEDRPKEELGEQYKLENMLSQQVIPYYGTFGNRVVTIPKGYGAYQQILLDARGLTANGVGAFYVATEMEMRCAMISYNKWKDFIMQYNDTYMESTEENDIIETQIISTTSAEALPPGLDKLPLISENYQVTVPRSLWPCMSFGDDVASQYKNGFPRSPCNPPYGYPLYYHRATMLGIPEAGLTKISYTWNSQIMPAIAELENADPNSENFRAKVSEVVDTISDLFNIKDPETDEPPSLLTGIANFITSAVETGKEIGFDILNDHVTNVAKEMATLPRLAKKGTENAQKVHSFVKNIASECLGKKFLVKLPSKVNFNYDKKIQIDVGNLVEDPPSLNTTVTKGPFGFKPLPKGSGMSVSSEEYDDLFKIAVESNGAGKTMIDFLRYREEEEEEEGEGDDDGAIDKTSRDYRGPFVSNFNPFSNANETNYIPEPQGGFFKRELYKDIYNEETGENRALIGEASQGVKQQLIPPVLKNFMNSNGRVEAYVRFDNSEYLSFDGINQSDLSQSVIENGELVPDLNYDLDNLNESNTDFTRFYNKNDENKEKDETDKPLDRQVAFLKCSIDPEVYYSPKITQREVKVYGRLVKNEPLITLPKQIYDPETDSMVYTHGYQFKNWKPVPEKEEGDAEYDGDADGEASATIDDFVRTTEKTATEDPIFSGVVATKESKKSDEDCVAYALITLPGRIAPTVDARFRDGPYQLLQPESIKHFLTLDVVKGVAEFEEPAFQADPPDILDTQEDEEKCTSSKYQNAKELYKVSLEKLQYAFPQRVNLAMPSPVVPDIVCIPLRSTERYYGPWISSEVDSRNDEDKKAGKKALPRYKDLGGAVEFIKDENLAPWNYFGYTSLNEAGKIRATFANSLLLLAERGGFVVPDAPSGLSLGSELKEKGPLITNITVDIGTGGIKTTTQLDLYTVSFGKLHKQKEAEISKSSRERKKLSDERNALIRKGMGKSQSNVDYQKLQEEFNDKLKTFEFLIDKSTNAKLVPATEMVATVKSETMNRFKPDENGDVDGEQIKAKRTGVDTAMQPKEAIADANEKFPTFGAASKSYYNSAGGDLGKMYTPASMEPYHQNMPATHDNFIDSKDGLYFGSNADFDDDKKSDITIYED